MAKTKQKPPLRGLHELMFELQEAAGKVSLAAYGLLGAISAHCDMLESFAPGASEGLRKVAAKYEKELEEARNRLYRL